MTSPEARGRGLVAGAAWNAAGRGLPLLLALVLTPILLHQLGIERWGLFTLALAMVGVFGIFDLGLGPALTRALSERIGSGDRTTDQVEEARLVGSAITTLGGLSLLGGCLLFLAVPWLVRAGLNVPAALQGQAIDALRVLVLAAPLVVINAALWGVLAAHQRFRAANLVTIPVSIFYYLGPVLVLLVWDSLVGVMLALVACRAANTLSYALLVRPLVPGLRLGRVDRRFLWPLLRMGGWMTFSGTLTQALLYADRFIIGALMSLAAVAYYATPLDLVLRFWILPVAVGTALLPAMAGSFRARPAETAALLRRGALLIMLGVLPPALLLVTAAHPILRLWLGADFADGGAGVMRILGVGVFFSCLAFAPGSLLDAIGRPDVTARFGLAQAVVFLPLSALLLLSWGIEGAALAWALRSAVDGCGKLVFVARLYPAAAPVARAMAPPLLAGGATLALLALVPSMTGDAVLGLLGLGLFLALALRSLPAEERAGLRAALRQPRLLLRPGLPAGGTAPAGTP